MGPRAGSRSAFRWCGDDAGRPTRVCPVGPPTRLARFTRARFTGTRFDRTTFNGTSLDGTSLDEADRGGTGLDDAE
ncbi:MAG: pentapeptide repeat-containing protein [Cumulibacter sp.]